MSEVSSRTNPTVPGAVRTAFLLWLVAVGAGIVETVIRVFYSLAESSTGGLVTDVLTRLVVYSVVVYVTLRMRDGKNWARWSLAIILGVLGTISLVIEPITWLTSNPVSDVFARADLLFVLVTPVRLIHLVAVFGGLAFMFSPTANEYFRAAKSKARSPA